MIKERYYLKTTWQTDWTEVSRKQFVRAERDAGFYPKGGDGPVATAGFISGSVRGQVDYTWKEENNGL